MSTDTYYVVLQDQFGVRVIVDFGTEEHFLESQASLNGATVIPQGVTFEQASELAHQTPGEGRFFQELFQALGKGPLDECSYEDLKRQFFNAACAARADNQLLAFLGAMMLHSAQMSRLSAEIIAMFEI